MQRLQTKKARGLCDRHTCRDVCEEASVAGGLWGDGVGDRLPSLGWSLPCCTEQRRGCGLGPRPPPPGWQAPLWEGPGGWGRVQSGRAPWCWERSKGQKNLQMLTNEHRSCSTPPCPPYHPENANSVQNSYNEKTQIVPKMGISCNY